MSEKTGTVKNKNPDKEQWNTRINPQYRQTARVVSAMTGYTQDQLAEIGLGVLFGVGITKKNSPVNRCLVKVRAAAKRAVVTPLPLPCEGSALPAELSALQAKNGNNPPSCLLRIGNIAAFEISKSEKSCRSLETTPQSLTHVKGNYGMCSMPTSVGANSAPP